MGKITTSATTETFLRYFVAYHGLPRAIVSDRGSQFVGHFWKRLCQLLRINRRLSTAFHPETDGSTERKNQDVELYIRMFVNHAQDNWALLTPMAALALNNRESSATNVSPFFLDHGLTWNRGTSRRIYHPITLAAVQSNRPKPLLQNYGMPKSMQK
jgi:transposase InsO family protein